MLLIVDVTVFSHETIVVRAHDIVVFVLDTAFRQDRLWQGRIIIGVSIEQRVRITDGRVVVCCIDTGTIGIGLVRVVHHVVLALSM